MEKTFDRMYLERLSQAYEDFFRTYDTAPVLTVDTSHLDVVHNGEDRTAVFEYIEATLWGSEPEGAVTLNAQPRLGCAPGMVPA